IEQQVVVLWPAPAALRHVLALAVAKVGLGLYRAGLELPRELLREVLLPVVREGELVLLRGLDGDASTRPAVPFLGAQRPAQIVREDEVVRVGVEEGVGHRCLRAPPAPAAEEPDAIGDDRTAQRR